MSRAHRRFHIDVPHLYFPQPAELLIRQRTMVLMQRAAYSAAPRSTDVADEVLDRICQIVCRTRQLTDKTLRLFLVPQRESIELYDCAGASGGLQVKSDFWM